MKRIIYITVFLSLLLLISITFNLVNNNLEKKVDREFLGNLNQLNSSFKFFNENPKILTESIRESTSYIGSVRSLCKLTSFSKKNQELIGTLSELNIFFINSPEDKILLNIDKISDYLTKLYDSPSDIKISEDFKNYLFEIENK